MPSAPGGSNDKTARTIEKVIQERRLLSGTLAVVNKPGGGGNIAFAYLNQHAGDAHYIVIGTPSVLTNHITGMSALTYADYTPVALLFSEYIVFAVKPDSPMRTGKDLAARLKDARSISVAFATTLGNHNHIAAALLTRLAGGDVRALRAVVFKGSAEATSALMGGHVDLVTTAAANIEGHIQAGRLRAVGVAAPERLPGAFAEVPTWKEQGIALVLGASRSVFAPRGLSAAQSAYWEELFAGIVQSEEWKQDLRQFFWTGTFLRGEDFRKRLALENAELKSTLTELGLAKQ